MKRVIGFCSQSVVIVQQSKPGACRRHISGKDRPIFNNQSDVADREQGRAFMPRFDDSGLLSAVVQHAETMQILMVAFMDREALEKTRETGFAHFHSRSRGRLWMKGESSGHVLKVKDILVDCDQDAIVLKALPKGPTCHTGATSCFYRSLDENGLHPAGE